MHSPALQAVFVFNREDGGAHDGHVARDVMCVMCVIMR